MMRQGGGGWHKLSIPGILYESLSRNFSTRNPRGWDSNYRAGLNFVKQCLYVTYFNVIFNNAIDSKLKLNRNLEECSLCAFYDPRSRCFWFQGGIIIIVTIVLIIWKISFWISLMLYIFTRSRKGYTCTKIVHFAAQGFWI